MLRLKAEATLDFCLSHGPCSVFRHRPGDLYAWARREWERAIGQLREACSEWCRLTERELEAKFDKLTEKKMALGLREALVSERWERVDHALEYFENRGTKRLSARRRRRLERYAVLARLRRTRPWVVTGIRPALRLARRARTGGWWRPWRPGLKERMDLHLRQIARELPAEGSSLRRRPT